MTPSSLTITIGLFFLLMAAVASWLFRTASIHGLVKVIVPSILVILACSLWYTIPTILGYPFDTAYAGLPQQAELIAFVPRDEEKLVDLWLREGSKDPRAYSVPLTDDLKQTLQKAKKALDNHDRAELAKRKANGKKRPPGYMNIDGGDAPYELLDNAFALPKKEQ